MALDPVHLFEKQYLRDKTENEFPQATFNDLRYAYEMEGHKGIPFVTKDSIELLTGAVTLDKYAKPGTADHTSAIQAALDEGQSFGKRTVVVTPGTWNFTNLVIRSNTELVGGGGVLRYMDGTAVDSGVAYYPILVPSGSENVVIRGVIIDGNKENNPSSLVCDSITASGNRISITDNIILNSPDSGIMFSRVTNSECSRNIIQGGDDVGIYVNDGADGAALSDNTIQSNKISGFPYGGIALKRSVSKTIVTNNHIYGCGNGITLEQASTSSDYSTDVTIGHNRLRDIGQNNPDPSASVGINLRGSANCIVTGNRIDQIIGRGIYVQGTTDSVISSNVITHAADASTATGYGIVLDRRLNVGGCAGIAITGNVSVDAQSRGIHLIGASDGEQSSISIVGNIVMGARLAALRIDAPNKNISIVGNTLSGDLGDTEIYAGSTYKAAANILVTGVSLGGFAQPEANSDGSLPVGQADTYFKRVAPDVIEGPQYRSRTSVRAQNGSASATLGNVGVGTIGLNLDGAHLYNSGSQTLTSRHKFRFDGEVGFFNRVPQPKAADPGTATGTDATVINNIVSLLRNYGLVE